MGSIITTGMRNMVDTTTQFTSRGLVLHFRVVCSSECIQSSMPESCSGKDRLPQ